MKKAREALKEKVLQKEFRYGELGVMSRKDFIQYLKNNGGTVKREKKYKPYFGTDVNLIP